MDALPNRYQSIGSDSEGFFIWLFVCSKLCSLQVRCISEEVPQLKIQWVLAVRSTLWSTVKLHIWRVRRGDSDDHNQCTLLQLHLGTNPIGQCRARHPVIRQTGRGDTKKEEKTWLDSWGMHAENTHTGQTSKDLSTDCSLCVTMANWTARLPIA